MSAQKHQNKDKVERSHQLEACNNRIGRVIVDRLRDVWSEVQSLESLSVIPQCLHFLQIVMQRLSQHNTQSCKKFSTHNTTYLHNCNNYFNSFIYEEQFSQKKSLQFCLQCVRDLITTCIMLFTLLPQDQNLGKLNPSIFMRTYMFISSRTCDYGQVNLEKSSD